MSKTNGLLFLLICCLMSCQDNSSPAGQDVPAVVAETGAGAELSTEAGFSQPAELNYYGKAQSNDLKGDHFNLFSRFYPIGWSGSSKFAYIREPAVEASDEYFYHFIIQDAISDRELVNMSMEKKQWDEPFDAMWERNKAAIIELLELHQIEANSSFEIIPDRFEEDGKSYELSLNVVKTLSDFAGEVIESQLLWVKSMELGRKLIFQDEKKEFSMLLNAEAIGQLRSPLEKRMMVIIKEEQRGYEGPPHVLDFRLIGYHLTENFE